MLQTLVRLSARVLRGSIFVRGQSHMEGSSGGRGGRRADCEG